MCTTSIYPIICPFACCEAQPSWVFIWRPVSRAHVATCVLWLIDVDTRQVLHHHFASSSHGPRVKKHGESWDVITQSVCAILIKTLLTVLHYWNTPHWNLLNSLNKLTPVSLLIHRLMSTIFLSSLQWLEKNEPPPQKKKNLSKLGASVVNGSWQNLPEWGQNYFNFMGNSACILSCIFFCWFQRFIKKNKWINSRKLWWSFCMRLRSTSLFFPLGFLAVSCVPLICVALMC